MQRNGRTALAVAAFWAKRDVAEYLLEQGADPTTEDYVSEKLSVWCAAVR